MGGRGSGKWTATELKATSCVAICPQLLALLAIHVDQDYAYDYKLHVIVARGQDRSRKTLAEEPCKSRYACESST